MQIDPQHLLLAHLETIERVVAFTCRRHGLEGADAEDFASCVKLRLVEDDYAVLRKFEGRSSLKSFLAVVVQRLLLDDRNHQWGKWHSSAEARRLGDLGVAAEKLLRRDSRSIAEALPILAHTYPGITVETIETLAARLPSRAPRHRNVDLAEAQSVALTAADETERATRQSDHDRASMRLSSIMRRLLEALPDDDQLILQLRFESGMTVAQVARSLRLDQKSLYRRVERLMRTLRGGLVSAGVAPDEARELIEHPRSLDFGIGNPAVGPSTVADGGSPGGQKEISE